MIVTTVAPSPTPVPTSTSPRSRNSRTTPSVWWLSPIVVSLLVVPLSVLSCIVIDDGGFRANWRSPKGITLETDLRLLASGLMLVLGAAVLLATRPVRPRSGPWPNLKTAEIALLTKVSGPIFALTIVGYVAYVISGVRSGITLAQITGSFGDQGLYSGEIKRELGTVPGLTTLTQVGVASAVISSLLIATSVTRRQMVRLATVIALTLPRAFLVTERLAFLELVVPVVVVFALRLGCSQAGRRVLNLVPIIAAPFVLVLFGVFEYSRSWVFFRATSTLTFPQFALERFIGYYATALNNGALQMTYGNYPGRWPYETLSALWTAPGVRSINLYQILSGHDYETFYADILTDHGNLEFNNSSGLAAPFVDYGTTGGLLYMLVAGILIGLLYRGFRESEPLGMLLYPVLFLGIVELPRHLSWAEGRLVPAYVVLGVVAAMLRKLQRRQSTSRNDSTRRRSPVDRSPTVGDRGGFRTLRSPCRGIAHRPTAGSG